MLHMYVKWNARRVEQKKLYSFWLIGSAETTGEIHLIRFLARKEKQRWWRGFKLSDEEVHSIERGIANVYYEHISSIKSRLLQMLLWEYHEYMRGGGSKRAFWLRNVLNSGGSPLPSLPIIPGQEWNRRYAWSLWWRISENEYAVDAEIPFACAIISTLRLPWHLEFLLWFIFFSLSFYPIRKALQNQNILFISFLGDCIFFHVYRGHTGDTGWRNICRFVLVTVLFSSDAAEIEDVKNQFWAIRW